MPKTDCLDLTDIYQKVGKRYQPRPHLQQLVGFDPSNSGHIASEAISSVCADEIAASA